MTHLASLILTRDVSQANLATGIVNLSMRTIEASPLVASGVLLVYMALVSVLATLLQHYNLSIKL